MEEQYGGRLKLRIEAEPGRFVMLTGRAESLAKPEETGRAMGLIASHNPTPAPAISETKVGAWRRPSNLCICRVRPEPVYGRRTA